MDKRAAIYVRTSSERQAEKASPEIQENDCRTYCESRGYRVVEVYPDIKKYRAGGRLVEPSGTRNDRPHFQRMLSDVDAGLIDVIVAWREDRLYRGVNRAMLEVNERVKDKIVGVELAKEHYDPTVATVKAWAAGVELEAKHDRFMMGVASRLSKGKAWNTEPPYGYKRKGDYLEMDPSEAQWVEKIFEWYSEDVSVKDIRIRLIAASAQQRQKKVKRLWQHPTLHKMLRYEPYWTGKQKYVWNEKEYKIEIPKIIDPKVAKVCNERRAKHKRYPAGNARHKTLAAGLAYCHVCGTRMTVKSNTNGRSRIDGTLKRYVNYSCTANYKNGKIPGCAGVISSTKLDGQIWDKVWSLVSIPGIFEEALEKRIAELQSQEIDAEAEHEKLQRQLDGLLIERQAVIGWARKGVITEDDLESQLMGLTLQQREIERQLADTQLLLGNQAERLRELGNLFREQVRAGFEQMNSPSDNPEIEESRLQLRKKIVHSIVKRVDVFEDKTAKVEFLIDLPALVDSPNVWISDSNELVCQRSLPLR